MSKQDNGSVGSEPVSQVIEKNEGYTKFFAIWFNLCICSLAYFIFIIVASSLNRDTRIAARSIEALTDIWPAAVLALTILV